MNVEEAANTLEAILDRITASIDDETRIQVRDALLAFRRDLSWDPEFAALRRIANDAFDDLGRAVNQAVIARMRERGNALAKYVETISAVADRADRNVDALRLKLIRSVTTASREIADGVRTIKQSIEANDLPAAIRQSEATLDKVLALIEVVSRDS